MHTGISGKCPCPQSCPAAAQFDLVMWQRPNGLACIHFSFCTMHENEIEIENSAHTQCEQCNARSDQLHCCSLESVSVRSFVWVLFVLQKINFHYTSAINMTFYGAFYRFEQFQFVQWCMETGIRMCAKGPGAIANYMCFQFILRTKQEKKQKQHTWNSSHVS